MVIYTVLLYRGLYDYVTIADFSTCCGNACPRLGVLGDGECVGLSYDVALVGLLPASLRVMPAVVAHLYVCPVYRYVISAKEGGFRENICCVILLPSDGGGDLRQEHGETAAVSLSNTDRGL